MGHALTNSAACDKANALALEKAKLCDGSKVINLRRRAWNSYDLAYVVEGVNGTRKDVVVTDRALKQRIKAAQAA
jgi:hypothetical protein